MVIVERLCQLAMGHVHGCLSYPKNQNVVVVRQGSLRRIPSGRWPKDRHTALNTPSPSLNTKCIFPFQPRISHSHIVHHLLSRPFSQCATFSANNCPPNQQPGGQCIPGRWLIVEGHRDAPKRFNCTSPHLQPIIVVTELMYIVGFERAHWNIIAERVNSSSYGWDDDCGLHPR